MTARIGLLLGDPTGIGPEVVAKLLGGSDARALAELVVIGDLRVFQLGQQIAGVTLVPQVFHRFDEVPFTPGALPLLDVPGVSPQEFSIGQLSAAAGRAVLDVLGLTLDLARDGQLDAVVFAPLNKQALHLAGSPFPDELHFMADRLQWTGHFSEINVLGNLWTSRVTSHVALKQVSDLLTRQAVYQAICLLEHTLRSAGIPAPRLAVAAFNPHGGEGGLFGVEERAAIGPAVEQARGEGIQADGPFPADTIFLRAKAGAYNGVVSMYHDQGQIAMKLMGFERGVTVQGGLPILITTPAHGTAFDIAGQGKAHWQALYEAFKVACRMGERRAARKPG